MYIPATGDPATAADALVHVPAPARAAAGQDAPGKISSM